MTFAGFDPGTVSTGLAVIDDNCRLLKYFEWPSFRFQKDVDEVIRLLKSFKPKAVALPSGFGLPFVKGRDLGREEIFLMALDDPDKDGPLRAFLKRAWMIENSFTLPGVIELESVPEYRKANVVDMGTADKVASAAFYMTMYDSFVLVEMGSAFTAVLAVKDRKIVDGFGGTILPGFGSLGCIDGEVAQLAVKIRKSDVYSPSDPRRVIEIARIFAEWYSRELGVPIIVSGKRKEDFPLGIKHSFPFKEAAVGAAIIANAYYGSRCSYLMDSLKARGTPIDHVRLQVWRP
ncbi:MAG: DUF1464 family protein [Thermoprotei archaeon]